MTPRRPRGVGVGRGLRSGAGRAADRGAGAAAAGLALQASARLRRCTGPQMGLISPAVQIIFGYPIVTALLRAAAAPDPSMEDVLRWQLASMALAAAGLAAWCGAWTGLLQWGDGAARPLAAAAAGLAAIALRPRLRRALLARRRQLIAGDAWSRTRRRERGGATEPPAGGPLP